MSIGPLRPHLVIPIKASTGSKQRLALRLPDREREMLSLSLAGSVVSLAAKVWPPDRVVVVSTEAHLVGLCQRLGIASLPDSGEGQTAAVRTGALWCLERGADLVATLAADLPGLGHGDLVALWDCASAMEPGSISITPDRGGTGTNCVLVRPGSLLVHAFGPDSRGRHQRIAALLGLSFRTLDLPGIAWDVDRPEDLEMDPENGPLPHPVLAWVRAAAAATQPIRAAQECPGD